MGNRGEAERMRDEGRWGQQCETEANGVELGGDINKIFLEDKEVE